MVTSIAGGVQTPQADAPGAYPAAPSAAENAVVPPTIPTGPLTAQTPSTEDPVSLLAEAVGQLKLAVAALNRSADGSDASTPPAGQGGKHGKTGADTAERSQIEKEIAATQDEVAALLTSRQGGLYGPGSLATYGDASMPFAAGSLADSAGFFSDHTSEPDL